MERRAASAASAQAVPGYWMHETSGVLRRSDKACHADTYLEIANDPAKLAICDRFAGRCEEVRP